MGGSRSKQMEMDSHRPIPKMHRTKHEVDLSGCPARVDKINISGLGRTHDDYVQRAAKGLFTAKNFKEVVVECNNALNNLHELGIYKDLRVHIDVSKGKDASEYGYEVTFAGPELSRVVGTVGTEIGQNEGCMTFELTSPNIWGRGERLTLNGSYSNHQTTDVSLRLSKPYLHTTLGDYKPEISLGIFRHAMSLPINSYKTQNTGLIAELKFLFPLTSLISHSFQYEASFRELSTLNKKTPFFVHKDCGPRMASLVRHIASYDQRDSLVLPTRGVHVKWTNEWCGLGGNISYIMENVHAEVSVPLFAGISAQLVTRLGIMKSLDKNMPEIPISSLFTLGGALSLRGFQYGGVGPHNEGVPMGMHSYWATGLHIWAPLPFYSYLGRFGNHIKSHLFYNFGNCDSFTAEKIRSAAGLGVALRLGDRARIEFNYCYPIEKQKQDRSQPGFQFGIGYEFI